MAIGLLFVLFLIIDFETCCTPDWFPHDVQRLGYSMGYHQRLSIWDYGQNEEGNSNPGKSGAGSKGKPPVRVEYSNRDESSIEPNMDLSPTAYNKENGRFFGESAGLAKQAKVSREELRNNGTKAAESEVPNDYNPLADEG
jgi:hypothetical protein